MRVLVAVARFFMNLLYKAFCLLPRRDEALFFSRQANEPSVDFTLLGAEFQRRGYRVAYLTKKLSAKTVVPYAFFAVREIYHLARCRVCFLDRYDPVVCLLKLKCERYAGRAPEGCVHVDFPTRPVVVQLWHAYGAFKKFGYQSLDTPEGRTSAEAALFRIHGNYSWVCCTGGENRQAFAQAFSVPVGRVVALGRPELDTFSQACDTGQRDQQRDQGDQGGQRDQGESQRRKPVVLFAPTLRKDAHSPHPLVQLYRSGSWKRLEAVADVVWSFHPLEAEGVASGHVSDNLKRASVVVTDYSSIVYEAYLLGKRVFFYVPDIAQYRVSPGLNRDPEAVCPGISFEGEDALFAAIEQAVCSGAYAQDQLDAFVGSTFSGVGGCTCAIADFACEQVCR